jgi:psp operon transcriptional activator
MEHAISTEQASPPSTELLDRPLKKAVWELKVRMLERSLDQAKYNQKKAASILGLTYHQFRGLYRQYRKSQT